MEIRSWKPISLEAVDHLLIHDQQLKALNKEGIGELPRRGGDHAWLLVQFGADNAKESVAHAEHFVAWLRNEKGYDADRMVISRSRQEGGNSEDLWEIRESGLGSTAFPPDGGDHWPGWEDSAVPPAKVADYLRDLLALYDKYHLRGAMYGHLGEGCIHSRINFDLRTAEGIASYRAFLEEAADLVASYGGSISGEHGDGQQRAELLGKQYGPRLLAAMREFKTIWDPDWRTCGWAPITTQPARTSPFPIRRMAGTSRTPRCAASGWASAGCLTRRRPCAPVSRSPGRRSTPPAGGPGCCSRCCAAR
jgi:FAD/FMN-containing dehydrogenase